MDNPTRVAREIAELDRRLSAVERQSQLTRSSIDVDGEVVTVAQGVAAGFSAGATADAAATTANAAAASASQAIVIADGKATVIHTLTGDNTIPDVNSFPLNATWFRQSHGEIWRVTDIGGGTKAWRGVTLADATVRSVSAAKIITGRLQAAVEIIAGDTAANHFRITSTGMQGWRRNPGDLPTPWTQTLKFDTDTGQFLVSDIETVKRNGRSVRLTTALDLDNKTGYGATEAGIIFPTNAAGSLRYAQLYSTLGSLHVDSPAWFDDTTATTHSGTSFEFGSDYILGYVAGQSTPATAGFKLGNDLSWSIGIGAKAYANPDGYFQFGTSDRAIYGRPDGTWGIGHFSPQGVIDHGINTAGNTLQIIGRQGGGDVDLFVVGSSFFNVRPHSGGGMYVHGAFGAAKATINGEFIVNHNGYFAGTLQVAGNFSSANKHFRIPHPDPKKSDLDLMHSCVESPDQGVLYDGQVTLDKHGRAEVPLADYVPHLIGDRPIRVALGVVGDPALVGRTALKKGTFTITGPAGTVVDYIVKSSRGEIETEVPRDRPVALPAPTNPSERVGPKLDRVLDAPHEGRKPHKEKPDDGPADLRPHDPDRGRARD